MNEHAAARMISLSVDLKEESVWARFVAPLLPAAVVVAAGRRDAFVMADR